MFFFFSFLESGGIDGSIHRSAARSVEPNERTRDRRSLLSIYTHVPWPAQHRARPRSRKDPLDPFYFFLFRRCRPIDNIEKAVCLTQRMAFAGDLYCHYGTRWVLGASLRPLPAFLFGTRPRGRSHAACIALSSIEIMESSLLGATCH